MEDGHRSRRVGCACGRGVFRLRGDFESAGGDLSRRADGAKVTVSHGELAEGRRR